MKRKLLKWSLILILLLGIQTLTYFTFAQRLLKSKLLEDDVVSNSAQADSLYVSDFYVSSCYTGFDPTYTSHHLSNDEDMLKKKFHVNYVYFDSKEKSAWADSIVSQFSLVYYTWTAWPQFNASFFQGFSAYQTEILQTQKRYIYRKEETYHWVFFFWIETYESSSGVDSICRNREHEKKQKNNNSNIGSSRLIQSRKLEQ